MAVNLQRTLLVSDVCNTLKKAETWTYTHTHTHSFLRSEAWINNTNYDKLFPASPGKLCCSNRWNKEQRLIWLPLTTPPTHPPSSVFQTFISQRLSSPLSELWGHFFTEIRARSVWLVQAAQTLPGVSRRWSRHRDSRKRDEARQRVAMAPYIQLTAVTFLRLTISSFSIHKVALSLLSSCFL